MIKINYWRNLVLDHMKGKGLEIGAYIQPFPYDINTTTMVYQDRFDTEYLKKMATGNPHFPIENVAKVDVIGDAHEKHFENNCFDFIVNSHLFEHLYNPLLALKNWLLQLKDGGYLYIVIPDKNETFDSPRDVTSVDHIIDDFKGNITSTSRDHYIDFYGKVHGVTDIDKYCDNKDDFHVHTFTNDSVMDLFTRASLFLPFTIIDHKVEGINICILLRRT